MGLATGLDLLGWSALAAFLIGLAFVARSVLGRADPGARLATVAVVPLGGGLVLAAIGIAGLRIALQDQAAPLGVTAVLLALGEVFIAIAVLDLVIRRVVPALGRLPRLAGLAPDRRWDVSLALVLVVLSAASVLWLRKAEQIDLSDARAASRPVGSPAASPSPTPSPTPSPSPSPSPTPSPTPSPSPSPSPPAASLVPPPTAPPASSASPEILPAREVAADPSVEPWADPLELVTAYALPGGPSDIVADGPRSGYISTDHAGILRYELPAEDGGPLRLRVVASDVQQARGVAIKDRVLYAVELGPFPCAPELPICEGANIHPERPERGELEILDAMRGRVLAWDITPDGSLAGRRTIITDLPVVDEIHGINGMELGPDGWIYLPVGGIDRLWWDPDQATGHTPHPELIGTLLRFDGTSMRPEVVVDGLRNVFEVAFDGDGRLWAVDNDGNAQDGYRFEELLQLKPGHHYGYPYEGTFGPKSIRDDAAVWLSETAGTGALVWAPDVGLGEGMLIGGCGALTRLTPDPTVVAGTWEHRLLVGAQSPIYPIGGCMTGAEPIGDRTMLAGVFGGADGRLLVMRFAEPPSPSAGPGGSFQPWAPPG